MSCPPLGELERLHGEGTLADTLLGASPCPPVIAFLTLGTVRIWGQGILCHGAALCLVGYLPTSLASTHGMPVAPSPLGCDDPNISRHRQISPGKGSRYPVPC